TLVRRYPNLGPARILDALSFAYDNQDLIEADLEREQSLFAIQGSAVGARPLAQLALPFVEDGDSPFTMGEPSHTVPPPAPPPPRAPRPGPPPPRQGGGGRPGRRGAAAGVAESAPVHEGGAPAPGVPAAGVSVAVPGVEPGACENRREPPLGGEARS